MKAQLVTDNENDDDDDNGDLEETGLEGWECLNVAQQGDK